MENNKRDILIKFGKRIAELRKKRNISQEKLADLSNLHRTYIGMIERGEKNLTLFNMIKIAKALDVSLEELVKGLNG